MSTKSPTLPDQAREHDKMFHDAFAAVAETRARHVKVRPHRAITPLKVTPWLMAQAIVLPLVLCALLWVAQPQLMDFWRQTILYWAQGLDLPFMLLPVINQAGQPDMHLGGWTQGGPLPGQTTLLLTAAVTLLAFAASLRMTGASLPLKYPLRIFAVVQGITLIYFWLTPGDFPYTVPRHSEELLTIGYVVMLATPVMLSMGYYILNQSLAIKLLHTALILLFFIVLIPHQVLAQAFIMQHLSILFMPVLYICFGAVFDALVFVALYSWAVSQTTAQATR